MASSTNSNSDLTTLKWDHSPKTWHAYYELLPRFLAKRNSNYRLLWQSGCALERGKTIASSLDHAYHLSQRNVQRGTFDDPHPFGALRLVDTTVTVPSGSDPFTNSKANDAGFTISFQTLKSLDTDLFEDILDTYTLEAKKSDARVQAGCSGIRMLGLLAQHNRRQPAERGAWAASQLSDLIRDGIDTPDVIGFTQFRTRYEELNVQKTRPNDDGTRISDYCQAVRNLGEFLSAKLDIKLDSVPNAHTDLSVCLSTIEEVLTKEEFRNQGSTGGAHALGDPRPFGAKDPSKNRDPRLYDANGKRKYVKGVDNTCTVCDGKHGGGHHLRVNCPDYDPAAAATARDKKKEKKGGRGGARVLGTNDEQRCCLPDHL